MSRYLFDEMAIEREIICLLSIVNASGKNHELLSKHLPEVGIFYTEWTLIQELLIIAEFIRYIIEYLYIIPSKISAYKKVLDGKSHESE